MEMLENALRCLWKKQEQIISPQMLIRSLTTPTETAGFVGPIIPTPPKEKQFRCPRQKRFYDKKNTVSVKVQATPS